MADGMDRVEPGGGEEDGADAAAVFEALRAEVAGLGRRLDVLARQVGQAVRASAPDYSPTLGAIAKELRAVGDRLDGIEAHPALRVTPGQHTQQVAAGLKQVREGVAKEVEWASTRLEGALHELREIVGSAHGQFAQQRREWIMAAIGASLGFMIWWPLVWLIPWGGGDRLAATLIGGGRWGAGQTLMREADPETWRRMVRLYNACPRDSSTDLCEAAMAVRTIPPVVPAQPAPEEVRPLPPAAVPSPSRSRAGTGR